MAQQRAPSYFALHWILLCMLRSFNFGIFFCAWNLHEYLCFSCCFVSLPDRDTQVVYYKIIYKILGLLPFSTNIFFQAIFLSTKIIDAYVMIKWAPYIFNNAKFNAFGPSSAQL